MSFKPLSNALFALRAHLRARAPAVPKKDVPKMKIAMTKLRATSLPILILAICSLAFAQQQKPTPDPAAVTGDEVVRVETTLITVPVSVMDRQGRFIADLQKTDFHLFEGNVEQEIAFFETADKPFTVALVLDMSESTEFKLKEIQDAANGFLAQLRPEDRVIIVAFDKGVYVLAEPTSDRGILSRAIGRTRTGGGTSLYSAIDRVMGDELSRVSGRKAIVLFTDGVDTSSSDSTYQSTLRTAEELDALAYAIQYETYDDAVSSKSGRGAGDQDARGILVTAKGESLEAAYKRADRYLNLLADKTGGRYFLAASPKSLKESFERIAQELRHQYSLGFYPQTRAAGKSRQLKVRVNRPDVAVRARKSYIYKGPSDAREQK